MKQFALALLAASAAGFACAQSGSVTLFGVVDATVSHYKTDRGASATRLGSGGMQASRLGFRGNESLGGGLNASFWLEGDINLDSGSGGSTSTNNQASGAVGNAGLVFGRRSTVSLSGDWGEVRLGRDYTPTFWNFAMFDPFMMQGVASGSNLLFAGTPGPATGTIRNSNTIGYLYNTAQPFGMSGAFVQLQYGMGENLSNVANDDDGNYYGFRAGYAQGPWVASIAHSHWTNLAVRDMELTNLGASWDFGVAKAMASYHVAKSGLPGSRQKTLEIGTQIPLGVGYIPVSFLTTKRDNAAGSEARQIAIGYVHNLSKRTALYTSYARISNKNGANFSVGGPAPIPGVVNASSSGVDFGFRHIF